MLFRSAAVCARALAMTAVLGGALAMVEEDSFTLDVYKRQEYPRELYDFYILADNCTDRTVEVARRMGANVLESHKESPDAPTGKPIVLQKALNALDGYQDHYDLVMFFDADNLIDPNMFLEVNSQYLSRCV